MANITISSMRKTETIDLNGGMTLRKALSVFFRVNEDAVQAQLNNQSVRLNSNTLNIPDDLTSNLRQGDVVSVYPAEVARGGVKGARPVSFICA